MDTSTLPAAFLMGIVAGLRSMTPLAVIAWAVARKWLNLEGTWLSFLGNSFAPYILSALALGEFVGDKLPTTPSRKAPGPFIFRIVIGIVAGLALTKMSWTGAVAGGLGAVCGTLGGYQARTRLVKLLGSADWPVAVGEDCIAVGSGILITSTLSSVATAVNL